MMLADLGSATLAYDASRLVRCFGSLLRYMMDADLGSVLWFARQLCDVRGSVLWFATQAYDAKIGSLEQLRHIMLAIGA